MSKLYKSYLLAYSFSNINSLSALKNTALVYDEFIVYINIYFITYLWYNEINSNTVITTSVCAKSHVKPYI